MSNTPLRVAIFIPRVIRTSPAASANTITVMRMAVLIRKGCPFSFLRCLLPLSFFRSLKTKLTPMEIHSALLSWNGKLFYDVDIHFHA
jgi:hypothetical protein